MPGFGEDCTADAQCTDGDNGRCMAPLGGAAVNQCSYDQCFSDADCDSAAETNRVVFDSTNDNLYFCSGASGWRKLTTTAP